MINSLIFKKYYLKKKTDLFILNIPTEFCCPLPLLIGDRIWNSKMQTANVMILGKYEEKVHFDTHPHTQS